MHKILSKRQKGSNLMLAKAFQNLCIQYPNMWGAIDGLGLLFFEIVLQKDDHKRDCLS
jgi:hypothetical protein